ncbi:response regulator [Caldimonas brevitalea]|uniref:response regulator n=1 Tax=Caldimonas brevitalea TaxID=413882 RepID=UPI001EEF5DB1|nr:response regulator [Caldimonas brevitalea]
MVLVVDDNVDAADSLRCLLELLGCTAVTAYDGPSAVQLAAQARVQLAIIDLDLPGFDGCEVLRRLKSDASLAPERAVCLTGQGRSADRQRCLNAGFDEFWSKPLKMTDLSRALVSSQEAMRARLGQRGAVVLDADATERAR